MSTPSKLPLYLLLLSIVSCTNSPPVLTTDKPLVKPTTDNGFKRVPEEYWAIINDGAEHESFSFKDNYIRLGHTFTSALGKECRQLFVSKNIENGSNSPLSKINKRITCKNPENSSWFAIPAIVELKRSTSLFN